MNNNLMLSGNSAMLESQGSVLLPIQAESLGIYDALGFEAGDANLYRFVGNDPTDEVDPTGLIEMLPPGAPGAPTLPKILGNPTVQDQLIWFRRRQGSNGWSGNKEEGGWVLYNKRTGQFILTVDGVEQDSRYKTKRNRLPTRITPYYCDSNGDPVHHHPSDPSGNLPPGFVGPPGPDAGLPPGYPDVMSVSPLGGDWVVVALWHTHPGSPKGLTDPGDYIVMNAWGLPSIVQWGILPDQGSGKNPQ